MGAETLDQVLDRIQRRLHSYPVAMRWADSCWWQPATDGHPLPRHLPEGQALHLRLGNGQLVTIRRKAV